MDNLASVNVEIVKLKFLGFRDPNSLTAILMDTHFTQGKEYTAFRYICGDHESAYSVNTNLGEGVFHQGYHRSLVGDVGIGGRRE